MKTIKSETVKLKAKRTFIKKETCSRTFFYILDREFGYPLDDEEKAIDPLAGGDTATGISMRNALGGLNGCGCGITSQE
jgi:hypothetical protein